MASRLSSSRWWMFFSSISVRFWACRMCHANRPVVHDEPFAVLLADDLIDGEPPIIKQMVDVFQQYQCSILGVQNVPREQTGQYGIVSSVPLAANLEQVNGIVEKPKPEDAPST